PTCKATKKTLRYRNESSLSSGPLRQGLRFPQILGVLDQAPERDIHRLSDAVRQIDRWISLKPFNQRDHLGSNIRPVGQCLVAEKSHLSMFPPHVPKAAGEVVGQHASSLPALKPGLTGTIVPISQARLQPGKQSRPQVALTHANVNSLPMKPAPFP